MLYFEYLNTPVAQGPPSNNGIFFVCHAFSRDQRVFAALTEDKKLLTWTLEATAEIQQNMYVNIEMHKV